MPALLAHPWQLAMLGVPYTALPFMFLGYASLHITAGLIAVLNATAPLFAALMAHYVLKERLGSWRASGLVIGFAGVVILMWGSGTFRSSSGILAVLAVLATSLTWGLGAHYARKHLASVDAMVVTVGSLMAASVFLAPFAWASWPTKTPGLRDWCEVIFLGVASSGLGFLLYFRLLRRIGPVRAMSVTFLNPVVAMASAALYLGEEVTLQMLAGSSVVLLGTVLSLGLVGPPPKLSPTSQA